MSKATGRFVPYLLKRYSQGIRMPLQEYKPSQKGLSSKMWFRIKLAKTARDKEAFSVRPFFVFRDERAFQA